MKRILIFSTLIFNLTTTFAQLKTHLDQRKFTDRVMNVRQLASFSETCYDFYKNDQLMVLNRDYTFVFFSGPWGEADGRGGVYHIETDFGYFKVGDKLHVVDKCINETSDPIYIKDDFVYVEVPAGTSHLGNGVDANATYPPYEKLVTPVQVGKCEVVNINAHVLMPITFGGLGRGTVTTGPITVNGIPVRESDYTFDYGGEIIRPTHRINSDGSITSDGGVYYSSKTSYSGSSLTTLEYTHNGVDLGVDFNLQIGGIAVRTLSNNSFGVRKRNYLGESVEDRFSGNYTNSTFKVTFDEYYYRVYVDGVEVSNMPRFVVYGATGGTISNTSSLPYRTAVTYSPTASGSQVVTALVDGAMNVFQKFQVAEDMTINPSSTNTTCGADNGSISVSIVGGKSPYTYNINGGAYGSSNSWSGLAAGNYTIGVRDASGCTTSRNVSVGATAALGLSVSSQSNETCAGDNTGSVTVSATGGITPYNYSKDGTNYGSSNTFSSLTNGTHTFYVRDATNCVVSTQTNVNFNSGIVAALGSSQNVSCFGGNNGSLSINTAGSAPNGALSYSKNGVDYQSGNTFTNLTAGNYTITVRDNTCSKTINASISEPSLLSVSATINNHVSCFGGSNGQITASGTGGSGSLQYSKDGSAYSSSNVFSGLTAGNYKIWVKDANACISESSISTITQPTALSTNVSSTTPVSCKGGANGVLVVNSSGGSGTHQYSKDATNYQASSTFSNLTVGAYTITVKDANNCTTNTSTNISEPSTNVGISLVSSSNLTCFQNNTGRIEVSGTGGTGSITYSKDGTTFGSSAAFSGLSAGAYTLYAKDANACSVSLNKTLTEPTALSANNVVSDNLCFGDNTGKITSSGLGGTGAYSYSKDGLNYGASGAFAGLTTGNYTIYVKDANGCAFNSLHTVNQPTVLGGNLSLSQHVSCFGGNNGSVQSTANGGTSPYQYSLNGGAYNTSSSFSGLLANNYSVHIKDANGCILQTNTVGVTQPTDLVPAIASVSDVKCHAGSDGVVSLSASGGVVAYQYSNNGTSYQSGNSFSGYSTGNHTFYIKDANACIKTIAAFVGQPSAPFTMALVSKNNLTCYQNNTGQITISGAGGTSPYQFSKDNSTFQSPTNFNGLSASTYTIYGKDANNCTSQVANISLTEPSDILPSLLRKKDIDCEDYSTGELDLTASGSWGGFSYILTGTDLKNNPVASQTNTTGKYINLNAGNYIITAQDQNGCTKPTNASIVPKNSGIRFDVAKTLPSTCLTSDGTVSISNVRGGTAPYSYNISTQNTYNTTGNFTNLLNGTYIVTVADALCAYRESVALSLPTTLTANYTIQPISCTTPNANLQINGITGGSGSYTWALNGGAYSTTSPYQNLNPNVYALYVQDNPLSCRSVNSIEIKEQNRTDLKVESLDNILCKGGNNGRITMNADNNTGPFTFAINNGAYGSTPTFTNLTVGTYMLRSKNSLGCGDSLKVRLTEPTLLVSQTSISDNLCNADRTGKIFIEGRGGVTPYQYSLDNGSYQVLGTFDNLYAGTYTVSVKDAHNCITPKTLIVNQPTVVEPRPVLGQDVSCFAGSDGIVKFETVGGTAPYTYSMDGIGYKGEARFENLPAKNHYFLVRDRNNCLKDVFFEVKQPTDLIPKIDKINAVKCFGGNDGSVEMSATGGTIPYEYSSNQSTYQNSSILNVLETGTYTVSVKDTKGCIKKMTAFVAQPAQPFTLSLTSKKDLLCFQDSTGEFEVLGNGGTTPYQYSITNTYQNSPKFSTLQAKDYTVSAKDVNACAATLLVNISEPTLLQQKQSMQENDCFGDATGKIFTEGVGGTSPYVFALENGTFSPSTVFEQLQSGTYQVKVKDKNNCLNTTSIEVKQPDEIKITPMYQDTVRCFGEKNGAILLKVTGGRPAYQYSKDGTNYISDDVFKNLGAGTYTFTVKDSKQCSKQATLEATQPAELQLSLASKQNPLCAGEQNGKIVLQALGGNGGNVFMMDNAIQNRLGVFENLPQGDYTFKVTDRRACEDTVRLVRLLSPKPILSSLSFSSPKCVGDQNGYINIETEGGIQPYTATLTNQTQNYTDSSRFGGLVSGAYQVRTQDANGCLQNLSIRIPEPEKLNAISLGDSIVVCKEQEVSLNANNPNAQVAWTLNGQAFSTQNVIRATQAGIYAVTAQNPSGCQQTATFKLINSPKALNVDFLMAVQAFIGDTVRVIDLTAPKADTRRWELGANAFFVESRDPTMSFVATSKGEHTVKLLAKKGECENDKERTIEIFEKNEVSKTNPSLHYDSYVQVNSMLITPNPNYGQFKVEVQLSKESDIELVITRSSNATMVFTEKKQGAKRYVFDVALQNIFQDMYIVTIKAGTASLYKKVLIMN